jgi:hypothetical protein
MKHLGVVIIYNVPITMLKVPFGITTEMHLHKNSIQKAREKQNMLKKNIF